MFAMRGIRVIIAGGKIPSSLQLHNLLDCLGYDAVVTENGEQALAILEAKPAKLIIFDGHLPARDVIATQEQIKRHPQWTHIPLVIMAAQHSKTAHDEYFPFGYEALLETPFDLRQLHTLMQDFLATGDTAKRHHPRIRFKIPVVVKHDGDIGIYQPLNLSEGGLYLLTEKPLSVGTAVDVSLTLPEQKPLQLVGLVIHQKGTRREVLNAEPGMAIKFQKSDKIAAAKLSRYISSELTRDLPSGEGTILNRA
jgi:CheY-like chemotaxis protein